MEIDPIDKLIYFLESVKRPIKLEYVIAYTVSHFNENPNLSLEKVNKCLTHFCPIILNASILLHVLCCENISYREFFFRYAKTKTIENTLITYLRQKFIRDEIPDLEICMFMIGQYIMSETNNGCTNIYQKIIHSDSDSQKDHLVVFLKYFAKYEKKYLCIHLINYLVILGIDLTTIACSEKTGNLSRYCLCWLSSDF